jgi:hypothetical protein
MAVLAFDVLTTTVAAITATTVFLLLLLLFSSPETANICLLEGSGRSYNLYPPYCHQGTSSLRMIYRLDHGVGIMFKSSQDLHVIPPAGAPPIEVGSAIPSFVSLRAASLPRAVAFLPYRLNCLHRPFCHHLAILLMRSLKDP